MIEGVIFIGTAIIAVTQALKFLVPNVNGAVTIFVAALLGLLVGLLDTHIGVTDLTVAQGIVAGLSAAGVHTVARQIG